MPSKIYCFIKKGTKREKVDNYFNIENILESTWYADVARTVCLRKVKCIIKSYKFNMRDFCFRNFS